MRILRFIVNNQEIIQDPNCDFTGLIKGTKGYLTAEFDFQEGYEGCGKIAVFRNSTGEYAVELEDNRCVIPEQALTELRYRVSVIGVKPGYRICTNSVGVYHYG